MLEGHSLLFSGKEASSDGGLRESVVVGEKLAQGIRARAKMGRCCGNSGHSAPVGFGDEEMCL